MRIFCGFYIIRQYFNRIKDSATLTGLRTQPNLWVRIFFFYVLYNYAFTLSELAVLQSYDIRIQVTFCLSHSVLNQKNKRKQKENRKHLLRDKPISMTLKYRQKLRWLNNFFHQVWCRTVFGS